MKYLFSGLLFLSLIILRHVQGDDASAALAWVMLSILWLIFTISDAAETIANAIERNGNKVTDRPGGE